MQLPPTVTPAPTTTAAARVRGHAVAGSPRWTAAAAAPPACPPPQRCPQPARTGPGQNRHPRRRRCRRHRLRCRPPQSRATPTAALPQRPRSATGVVVQQGTRTRVGQRLALPPLVLPQPFLPKLLTRCPQQRRTHAAAERPQAWVPPGPVLPASAPLPPPPPSPPPTAPPGPAPPVQSRWRWRWRLRPPPPREGRRAQGRLTVFFRTPRATRGCVRASPRGAVGQRAQTGRADPPPPQTRPPGRTQPRAPQRGSRAGRAARGQPRRRRARQRQRGAQAGRRAPGPRWATAPHGAPPHVTSPWPLRRRGRGCRLGNDARSGRAAQGARRGRRPPEGAVGR
jgi:hypothetical protein